MADYAYRALENGTPIRIAMAAPSLNEVVLSARDKGHHVVMLYEFVADPVPHFEEVLEHPNFPFPINFTTRAELRKIGRRGIIKNAINERRIEGRLDWFSACIPSRPILERAMSNLRRVIIDDNFARYSPNSKSPTIEEEKPKNNNPSIPPFLTLRKVDVPPDFKLSPDLFLRLDPMLMRLYRAVPFSIEEERVLLLAEDPLEYWNDDNVEATSETTKPTPKHSKEYHDALRKLSVEFYQSVAGPCLRVRCSDSPRTHSWMVRKILSSLLPEENLFGKLWKHFAGHSSDEVYEWLEQAPCQLQRLDFISNDLLESRSALVLEADEQRVEPCKNESTICNNESPIVRLAWLIISQATILDMDGVRVLSDRFASHIQYLHGNVAFPMDALSRRLHEDVLIVLAAACGIPPSQLAPAANTFEIRGTGGACFRVIAETSFNSYGEQIEIRWQSEDSSLSQTGPVL